MLPQEIVKQEAKFAIVVKGSVVTEIGKSFIFQPKTRFAGGSIRWLEEKTKKKGELN